MKNFSSRERFAIPTAILHVCIECGREQAVINTSTTTVYHINYVATDQNGLTATSTRTVIIDASAPSAVDTPPPSTVATTTASIANSAATSTPL
jgi:diaminopimelate decarboxylase